MESLTQKATRGVFWSSVERFAAQSVGFLIGIVLGGFVAGFMLRSIGWRPLFLVGFFAPIAAIVTTRKMGIERSMRRPPLLAPN